MLEITLESPLDCKEIKPVSLTGNQPWIFIGRTDAKAQTPILWPSDAKKWLIGKKGWCWERLKAGGKRAYKGWDGWMASPTQWTWVWVNSRSWRWTRKPGVLRFMGLQRVGYDWATELNWSEKLVLQEDKQNWQTFSQTHQEKKRRIKSTKIRNEKWEAATDNVEIQKL